MRTYRGKPVIRQNADEPYSLAREEERVARWALLSATNVAPLTESVEQLRKVAGRGAAIPYFDPLDGGVHARCLFMLEAPGPRAVESGFISHNNPDPTARNWHILLRSAGIQRKETILWNVVPWYIGTGGRIRAAARADITEGVQHLPTLFALLPHLEIIVLVGRGAQAARDAIAALVDVPIYRTSHPSNRVLNRRPETREQILRDLRKVAARLE